MPAELPQTLSPALPAGTALQEYTLLSVLGMGGFGITYLAADNNLKLKVAIKEFFPSSAVVRNQLSGAVALKSIQAEKEYTWGRDRFMREAQTLARFRHKNIVPVFRYFEGNGTCYMVMAYEEGQSLEAALEAGAARWNQQAVLGLVMPLLDGLESVHAAGFLHRDIKPANIVLRASDGSPVLIDFGAARAPTSGEALTVVLSHGYGPPEQYSREGHQGPWTDIYALGGVLYRIVSGSVPPISLHRIKQDPIIPATFSGEGRFGPKFLAAIDLALSVDERKRPQNIAEWRALLTADTTDPTATALPGAAGRAAVAASAPPARMPPATTRTEVIANARTAPTHAPTALDPAAQARLAAARVRTSQRHDDDDDAGLVGRIGQAMVAHPFLSLLLLVAALFSGLHYLRRPVTAPPAPAVAPAPQAGSRDATPPPRTAEEPAPAPAPERRDPAPASPPAPDAFVDRAPIRNIESPREFRNEAAAACDGKFPGAACTASTARDGTVDGTCVDLGGGGLSCRPARINSRPGEGSGAPGGQSGAWRQVPAPRIPR